MFSFLRRKKRNLGDDYIYPDQVFLDSSNLPQFNQSQFEGRIEKPISVYSIFSVGLLFVVVALVFSGRLWSLQIVNGEDYALQSENNRLRHTLVFAQRGVVFDRRGETLVWNEVSPETQEYSLRAYSKKDGLAHTLGYVKYPSKDSSGFFYQTEFTGIQGVEKYYDHVLAGTNGLKITETDVFGKITSESVIEPPQDGKDVVLSIDARVQEKLFQDIKALANQVGFQGGAGVIMDVNDGSILAITSFPEYNSSILSSGDDSDAISKLLNDKQNPFLNRVTSGLFTPGSIIKPFVAIAALKEKIISPEKQILSTGSISIPNPFFPDKPSVFRDWKAHGLVDMRQAIAVSSDVYFYEVGGGFQDQKGLGIVNIEKYMKMFGFASPTGIDIGDEYIGTIPSPEWKKEAFNGEIWRVGDTYNTSIGQYGFQVTPIQVVHAVASLANGGKLLQPSIVLGGENLEITSLSFDQHDFDVVREGMRMAVTAGTASGLNISGVSVAAKTGTAELGTLKQYVNSWVTGFFPYENPRYAFAIIMERGPHDNLIGATYVMRQLLEWMKINTPEYLK